MLLIWDIHANARHIKAILENLQSFTKKFPDEKNIVFLWDYMYMFSYDRQALGELFDLFLELRGQGKNVYVLTGNHDWLNQHFVYHEGKKALDMLTQYTIRHAEHSEWFREWQNEWMTKWVNKIYFITEPETHSIEWKEILFMPYNKWFLGFVIAKEWNDCGDPLWIASLRSQWQQTPNVILDETTHLLTSSNYNEQLSWALNHYLLEHYKPGITLIHHYYTANIAFPGQQAKFDYKDISLHPWRTTYADKIISGHLHKAFVYENYLCVWSMRSTTSWERNQAKFLWKRDTTTNTYEAYEIAINPYVVIESPQTVTVASIKDTITTIQKNHASLLPWVQVYHTEPDVAKTSLILYSTESVQDIESILASDVKSSVQDIQLKQTSSHHQDMTELLDMTQYNIKESLLDWKELVKKYLMSRYWEESQKYRTLLSELNIL
jgi:DNA repair exonuclease SbcCD nuclease subunit